MITSRDNYAVIGNPIAHSLSPQIHTAFAQQCQQNLSYSKIFAALDDFTKVVTEFVASGGKGLNVTLPFKEQAQQLCHRCSDRANLAGAVNTLSFANDGNVYGDITDGVGLVRDICRNHGRSLQGKRIALLGAGGAVRGVLGELLAERPNSVLIVNRNIARAQAIVTAFATPVVQACGYSDLGNETFDIVINGTAASLQDALPPLPANILGTDAYCYDMVYSREPTAFMRWARAQGATACSDGLGMLVEQAAEAFYIWRGVKPQTAPVIQWLRSQTSNGLVHNES